MLSKKLWGQFFDGQPTHQPTHQPTPQPHAEVTPPVPMHTGGHVGQFLPTGHRIGPSAELWEHEFVVPAAGKSVIGKLVPERLQPNGITTTKIADGVIDVERLRGRSASVIAVDEAMEKMERKIGQKRTWPERRVLGTGHMHAVNFHDDPMNDLTRVGVELICSRAEAFQLKQLMNSLDRDRKLELSQLLVDDLELSPSDDVAETASEISTKSEAVGSW